MPFSSFVRSSTLDGFERVNVDGNSPLNHFEATQAQIEELAGPFAGKLLCEPLISEGNGEAATTISWYAAYEGVATPITALDPARRASAEALLKTRIEALQPVIAAAPSGQMIASSLYLPDPSDVFVIGVEPVLTNWGLVKVGGQDTPARQAAAFAAGLGAFGLAMMAPPLSAQDFGPWRERLPGVQVAKPDAMPETAPAEPDQRGVPPFADDMVVASDVPWYRRAWAPALLAVLLATVMLIILLIPGVLLSPSRPDAVAIDDQARLLDESNQALEERLEQLRNARVQGICTPQGNFVPALPQPSGSRSPGADQQSVNPAQDDARTLPPSQSLLPPRLDNIVLPDAASQDGDVGTLLDFVDRSTVLVLAPADQQVGLGSAFFISPSLIVTNDHVIADGDPGQLFVTSQALGRVVPVELIARSGGNPDSKIDFALLRGSFASDQPFFRVSDQVDRLGHVVAAGFPLVVASEDALFQRLLQQGDPTAAPRTSTTRGVVTSIQSHTDGTQVIAHDAEINQGNSGGPLLDLCGRVVGVNTYLVRNTETNAVARFALHVSELVRFLQANNVDLQVDGNACSPQPATAPATPAAGQPLTEQGDAPITSSTNPVETVITTPDDSLTESVNNALPEDASENTGTVAE